MRRTALVACLALLAAAPVVAQDSVPWRVPEVGGWVIAIDKSLGGNGGCFILSEFDGAAVLRIGFDPSSANFYALIGDSDWTSINADVRYDLQIQFGNRPIWDAPATGGRMGDLPTLLVTTSDANFVHEMAGQNNMFVSFNGTQIANFSLRGSSRAVNEMLNCQDEMLAASGDPFAGGTGTTADPFAGGNTVGTGGKLNR